MRLKLRLKLRKIKTPEVCALLGMMTIATTATVVLMPKIVEQVEQTIIAKSTKSVKLAQCAKVNLSNSISNSVQFINPETELERKKMNQMLKLMVAIGAMGAICFNWDS